MQQAWCAYVCVLSAIYGHVLSTIHGHILSYMLMLSLSSGEALHKAIQTYLANPATAGEWCAGGRGIEEAVEDEEIPRSKLLSERLP